MKLKYLILLLIPLVICGCSKKEEVKTIPDYDSDIKCVKTGQTYDLEDGTPEDFISNIYVYLDDNENVESAIFQNISKSTVFDKATIELTNQLLSIYKDIDGIDAFTDTVDDKLIITIKYNYLDMDLDLAKKKLGSIIDEDNIIRKAKKLPFSYEEFNKYSLSNYECK
jgi:uncharacterized lipoprotein YehR (DUF1307 family)